MSQPTYQVSYSTTAQPIYAAPTENVVYTQTTYQQPQPYQPLVGNTVVYETHTHEVKYPVSIFLTAYRDKNRQTQLLLGLGDAGLAVGCIISSFMAWYVNHNFMWLTCVLSIFACMTPALLALVLLTQSQKREMLAEYTPHTSLFIIIGFASVILSILAWAFRIAVYVLIGTGSAGITLLFILHSAAGTSACIAGAILHLFVYFKAGSV